MSSAKQWFQEQPQLFAFRGGRLLANVFPEFTRKYGCIQTAIAAGGNPVDLAFLVKVLSSYSGREFTHDLTPTIIEALPANDRLLHRIGSALQATGGVRGEFDQVEAYRQKKQEVESWLDDPREEVRQFAVLDIYDLEQQFAAEQRRSEEDLEFRKRGYPNNDSGES